MVEKIFFVYIMASKRYGTLYTGVSSNLLKRGYEHKNAISESFTSKYNVKMLVYYEQHGTAEHAIQREKQIKDWKRAWKIELIEKNNPNWYDLYDFMIGQAG